MRLQAKYIDGELELWHEVEGGGFVIRVNPAGEASLFEIPQYGGEERYSGTFTNICEALKIASEWT